MGKPGVIWDGTGLGYTINVGIAPDDGVAVTAVLQRMFMSKAPTNESLMHDQLVPAWHHTLDAGETTALTLRFEYLTSAVVNVHVHAVCRTDTGAQHQQPLDDDYAGQQGEVQHPTLVAKP
jgi:hypothetical protein